MTSETSGPSARDRYKFEPSDFDWDDEYFVRLLFPSPGIDYESMSSENLAEEILEFVDTIRQYASDPWGPNLLQSLLTGVALEVYRLHRIRERIGVLLESEQDSALQSASEVLLIWRRRLWKSLVYCGGKFDDNFNFYVYRSWTQPEEAEHVYGDIMFPLMTLRDLFREYGTQLEGLAAKIISDETSRLEENKNKTVDSTPDTGSIENGDYDYEGDHRLTELDRKILEALISEPSTASQLTATLALQNFKRDLDTVKKACTKLKDKFGLLGNTPGLGYFLQDRIRRALEKRFPA